MQLLLGLAMNAPSRPFSVTRQLAVCKISGLGCANQSKCSVEDLVIAGCHGFFSQVLNVPSLTLQSCPIHSSAELLPLKIENLKSE